MFYLKHFFSQLKLNPVKGFFVVFSIGLLTVSATQKNKVQTQLGPLFKNVEKRGSFHALVAGQENTKRIQRKLMSLPGIEEVSLMDKKTINNQVSKLIKGIDLGVSHDLLKLNYKGVKVTFKEGIGLRAQGLIKDYFRRLVGKRKITIGATKTPLKVTKKSSFVNGVHRWGHWVIILSSALLSLFFLSSFLRELNESSYLVETYQRRSLVSLKSSLCGHGVLLTFWLLLSLSFGPVNILGMALSAFFILGMSLICLKEYQWRR